VLGFINHASMGVYRQSIDQFLAGETARPDITAHPRWTRLKYGFGLNVEQEVAKDVSVFARVGWNDGKTESYAYTEVDNTIAFGTSVRGTRWNRSHDRAGVAFVSNGLSDDHREYLALGGMGFILGDGGLSYSRETIVESYYRLHAWRGIYLGPGFQYVASPGYNRDRGPVVVPGFRLHFEL
jgi:high affinity Mn2+ porin